MQQRIRSKASKRILANGKQTKGLATAGLFSFYRVSATPMTVQQHQLESASLDEAKLVVRFTFDADRFRTSLLLVTASDERVLLRSLEGDASEAWPPSGPLQEVVPEAANDKPFLAGVGRGGKSHWSIIATTTDEAGIEFDMACRVKVDPDFVGSTYELVADDQASIQAESTEPNLVKIPGLGGYAVECRAIQGEVSLDGERLQIKASESSSGLPRTERWQYLSLIHI